MVPIDDEDVETALAAANCQLIDGGLRRGTAHP